MVRTISHGAGGRGGVPPVAVRGLGDFGAFRKNEERLQRLRLKPSEYVRQVRVTPQPHEDSRWIVPNSGPEVGLFSSDDPRVEGGRNALQRFDESLVGCTEPEIENFYCHHVEDLMGPHIPAPGQPLIGPLGT